MVDIANIVKNTEVSIKDHSNNIVLKKILVDTIELAKKVWEEIWGNEVQAIIKEIICNKLIVEVTDVNVLMTIILMERFYLDKIDLKNQIVIGLVTGLIVLVVVKSRDLKIKILVLFYIGTTIIQIADFRVTNLVTKDL